VIRTEKRASNDLLPHPPLPGPSHRPCPQRLLLRRLHGLGLTLDLVAFDEPVWFAHEKTCGKANGALNCAYPLPKVAHIVGITLTTLRKYFPDIEYGGIEPITPDRTPAPKLIAGYVQFAHLMQQESGQKMTFFHADIAVTSKGPWLPVMAMLKRSSATSARPFRSARQQEKCFG
jgi:hypothetical protein